MTHLHSEIADCPTVTSCFIGIIILRYTVHPDFLENELPHIFKLLEPIN